MAKKRKLSSTELGALWMTFQKKTMILRILEYFIETAEDKQAKKLMEGLWKELHPKVEEIKQLFKEERAALPTGFTSSDVNIYAPKLYDNRFDIMLCRILKEISMGLYTLHLTMAYREDIIKLYQQLSALTQNYYEQFTNYLMEEDMLLAPNFINMPKTVDYITDKAYLKGTNILGQKRKLNTIEYGYIYHGIETNIVGMQMITGFAQCAKNPDIKKYFLKGKNLSKSILSEMGNMLINDDIYAPATSGGNITSSTESPFSDKLMMFCTYLMCNFSLGGQSFGAGFSLRNDVNLKLALLAKDVYEYTREGVMAMIDHGWMEEPPGMDRDQLSK
ncbi:DUF3231 family protein [Niallia sp. NCCP-28]|uniref:DUF3231 family protein n=1 Tax=Niallia sp. NCCP-28 TaxID=2934712 RepID=UPI0020BF1697|nr:DUF3231 family protein [Niallia sp. NCCP-28]